MFIFAKKKIFIGNFSSTKWCAPNSQIGWMKMGQQDDIGVKQTKFRLVNEIRRQGKKIIQNSQTIKLTILSDSTSLKWSKIHLKKKRKPNKTNKTDNKRWTLKMDSRNQKWPLVRQKWSLKKKKIPKQATNLKFNIIIQCVTNWLDKLAKKNK